MYDYILGNESDKNKMPSISSSEMKLLVKEKELTKEEITIDELFDLPENKGKILKFYGRYGTWTISEEDNAFQLTITYDKINFELQSYESRKCSDKRKFFMTNGHTIFIWYNDNKIYTYIGENPDKGSRGYHTNYEWI